MAVKFRGLRHREVVLIDGPAGWGEFAPFADYTARETTPWPVSYTHLTLPTSDLV